MAKDTTAHAAHGHSHCSHIKVAGAWVSIKQTHIKVAGAWVPVKKGYEKIQGVWHQFCHLPASTP